MPIHSMPGAATCLDFVYHFTDHGPDVNQRFVEFWGFSIDAGPNPFGVHDPITASRTILGNDAVISFNFDQFGDEIQPHEMTVLLVIKTNAISFTTGYLSAQDDTAGSGLGDAPLVPEPAYLVMMGSGLIAIGGFTRLSLLTTKG